MTLRIHPERQRVLEELHARPFTPMASGTRLFHFGFQVTREEADEDRLRLDGIARAEGGGPVEDGCRYQLLRTGQLRWERHGEFVTYTVEADTTAPAAWPDDLMAPGRLLVAVDLRLSLEQAGPPALVEAALADGDALIASDFLPGPTGFIRIEVVNVGMTPEIAGAHVQRILELETYRTFALLGLPSAEKATRAIATIEDKLPDVMAKMDSADSLEDNKHLLDLLSQMTLELERSSAASHFRLGATRAYSELVSLRLTALAERPDPKRPGLAAFFSRRFDPAIRTCTSALDREAVLARKLTRAAQLLRTRVEIALESQNRDLLATMANRVRLQIRLQHTVEGLSVAAISYYIASLLHLMLSGAHGLWPDLNAEVATAASTPFIVATITLAMLRIRRHHREDL
jgi:uncharacterized membrane-anchored protein